MEEYRNIKGYEGHYQVSNLGNVKSLKFSKEKVLKHSFSSYGYKQVQLCFNGSVKTVNNHKLVAMAFLGHEPSGHNIVVDHIDNNPLNNNVNNLQLITQRENLSKDRKGSSKYRGVSWYNITKKWVARVHINGKRCNLGYFKCELAAAKAYNDKLKEITNV